MVLRHSPLPGFSYRLGTTFTLMLGLGLIACGGPQQGTAPGQETKTLDPEAILQAVADIEGFHPPAARRLTAEALAQLSPAAGENTEAATLLLNRALDLRPNYVDTLLLKARLSAKSGDVETALATVETLAGLGHHLPLAEDPGLKSLHEEARFQEALNKGPEPKAVSSEAFQLNQKDLIPESVVFDAATQTFFISSVRHRKIVRFASDSPDQVEDFLVSSPDSEVFAVLGMAIDSESRLLWAVSASGPHMMDFSPEAPNRSELLGIDLDSGDIRHRLVPPATPAYRLNDVTVAPDGTVYATSSTPPGQVYVAQGRDESPVLQLFGKPGLRSPQGLAVSEDGTTLFVADYSFGIAAHQLPSGERIWLEEPEGFFLSGVDGLTQVGQDLIAIQNGVRPHRVLRLTPDLDARGFSHAEILEQKLPQYSEPTLGTFLPGDDGSEGQFLYVANSQWDRFDRNHQLPPIEELAAPILMSLPLTSTSAETAQ